MATKNAPVATETTTHVLSAVPTPEELEAAAAATERRRWSGVP
jgi:hypothetical protein